MAYIDETKGAYLVGKIKEWSSEKYASKATTLEGYGIEDAVQKEDGKSLISAEDLAQITTNKNDIAKIYTTNYIDVTDRS